MNNSARNCGYPRHLNRKRAQNLSQRIAAEKVACAVGAAIVYSGTKARMKRHFRAMLANA